MVSDRDKEIMSALDGCGTPPAETEVQQEVIAMSQTNIFRPGIDVTRVVLLPPTTWRRHDKTEMVRPWIAKVYDMHNVVVRRIKSGRVPGAMPNDEFFNSCNGNETKSQEEERKQLEIALKMDSENENSDGIITHRHSCCELRDIPVGDAKSCRNRRVRSLCIEGKSCNLLEESPSSSKNRLGRHSMQLDVKRDEYKGGRDAKASSANAESEHHRNDGSRENKYKKGSRPILCLSPVFPLQTEELLPLLEILPK
ncbi:hypothetical protein Salat_0200800 [Sesamum alatum]|uniref:Ankyrin repeat domain-containing protein n=1 Tax=Sesamum alatum TaxID=300844 RepID=A0AAE2CY00_9LAMI|nr:hypothetical protein Salat_0200800 [Sesamum alatum]